MKKFLQILVIFILAILVPAYPIDCNNLDQFDGERLEFSMKFKGVNSANSILQTNVADSLFHINWKVKTRSLFKWLFLVDNEYNSFLNVNDCSIFSSNKNIHQKNVAQEFTTQYNRDNSHAISNFTKEYNVPNGCIDILTMLYFLRVLEKENIEQTSFIIDVESQVWNVSFKLVQLEDKKENHNTDFIEATFLPFGEIKKREWKTDLLTNRIARPDGKMIIGLGPYPHRAPLLLMFGDSDSRVNMFLDKRSLRN